MANGTQGRRRPNANMGGGGGRGDDVTRLVAALAGADQMAGLTAALGLEPGALAGGGGSETFVDPMAMQAAIRGPRQRLATGPRASGVPFIFTGGTPFPESGRERAASQVASLGALIANTADALASRREQSQAQGRKKRRGGGGA